MELESLKKVLLNFLIINMHKKTTGTNGEKGTGLGLILSKDFIQKHNGIIWVESELDKGSRFIFTLPDY